MATPSPDPERPSWLRLAEAARPASPPEIDVRAAVRAQLAAEAGAVPAPDWAEALLELIRLPWVRVGLAGACAVALACGAAGWQFYLREMPDPLMFALEMDAGAPLSPPTP
jgi:hypothetical protein